MSREEAVLALIPDLGVVANERVSCVTRIFVQNKLKLDIDTVLGGFNTLSKLVGKALEAVVNPSNVLRYKFVPGSKQQTESQFLFA